VIEQPGRLLADGTRRGGRTARKATFYLELETATRVKSMAADMGSTASDVVERALQQFFRDNQQGPAVESIGAMKKAARAAGLMR
jgi:hypothetical protein